MTCSLLAACSSGGSDAPRFALSCPAAGELAVASLNEDYVVDGSAFSPEPVTTWAWTVTGGACDQVLGAPTFAVSGSDTSQLVLRPTLPGDYQLKLTVTTASATAACEFPVRARAPGLRVALCWDTTGTTDLDLHVHRPGTTTPWFTTTTTGSTVNPDDCHYSTCLCSATAVTAAWGYAASPVAACSATRDGACWQTAGSCRNPRLEQENIATAGLPELVAVDAPDGSNPFRIMAHFYSGAVATHPVVSVYCGDAGEVATFGASPDLVPGFTTGGGYGAGPMWRVADVTAIVSGGVTTGCTVEPLHPGGSATGYWVTTNDRSY